MNNALNGKNTATILMHCPDQQGIVAKVTEFLTENNGNILYLEQHVNHEIGEFFMRIEWDLDKFAIPEDKIADYFDTLIAQRYGMTWNIYFSDQTPRMAIFVSKMSHCLFDILSRYQAGEWNVEIPMIISNHPDMEPVAKQFGIPYYIFPIDGTNKKEQEAEEIKLLKENNIDLIVLARYMQVLSEDFIRKFPNKVINIHHSFLPAFPGAKPYHSAHERGVKIIGATSHYVTADLDAGPIIEQDVVRISHTDSIKNLIRKGQDLEKIVLSRAVYAHLQRKVLAFRNRTVIFS
ncbi:MAG: formyltetrahydrofolate deformylase [Bacteroidota bacterium]|jgi:formyltetrahydrofolate deformylase|nr:formyltetrahydrofolate deformylase [Bacteroidota bacterium]